MGSDSQQPCANAQGHKGASGARLQVRKAIHQKARNGAGEMRTVNVELGRRGASDDAGLGCVCRLPVFAKQASHLTQV